MQGSLILTQTHDRWREPILDAHAEEAYVIDADGNRRRGVKYIISGDNRFENMGRILEGIVCANCLSPLPARPGLDTVSMFKQGQMNYVGFISEETALARVAQGRCPLCNHEVSTTMADVGFMGTQNRMGDIVKPGM
jgi:hypothetical protein